MRQRCEELLRRMIAGEEDLCLEEVQDCVILLKGFRFGPYVSSAAKSFSEAVRLLDRGMKQQAPAEVVARLRVEALTSLGVLVELKNADLT